VRRCRGADRSHHAKDVKSAKRKKGRSKELLFFAPLAILA